MQSTALDLGEGEAVVTQYAYKDLSGRPAEFILTNARLVALSPPHRQDVPLKGLQSIRVEAARNMGVILALAFGIVLSLGCAAVFGYTIFVQSTNAPVFMKTVPIGMLVIGLFLLAFLVRGGFTFARVVVRCEANTLQYDLATCDQLLLDFVRRVEQAL
jgi:hypothetical protein